MYTIKEIDNALRSGQLLEAESMVLNALQKEPDNLDLRYRASSIQLRLTKLDEALSNMQFIYEREPSHVVSYNNYPILLARMGQYSKALTIVKEYERKFGVNLRLLYTKGDIFYRLANWPLSKKYFSEYRTESKENLTVEITYCTVLIHLREFDEARILLKDLQEKNPTNPRIEALLKETTNGSLRHEKLLAQLNSNKDKDLITYNDYLLDADACYEFLDKKVAYDKYRKALSLFPGRYEVIVSTIQCALEAGDFDTAKQLWLETLNQDVFDLSLLTLERAVQSYAFEEELSWLLTRTQQKIQTQLVNTQGIKRIAIVGGSNSIMKKGWSAAFIESMQRLYHVKIDSYALGGISSLYGLTLIKEKRLFELYDIVLFEYTLNDVYFYNRDSYPTRLLTSVCNQLAIEAAKTNCKLVFCEFVPLSECEKSLDDQSQVVNIYKKIANQFKINYVSVTDLMRDKQFSKANIELCYSDEMHYASKFSQEISNRIIAAVLSGRLSNANLSQKNELDETINLNKIKFLPCSGLQITGNCEQIYRETSIIKATFYKLEKNSSLEFTLKSGQILLGVMINSSPSTGYIKVTVGDEVVFIKNIYVQRQAHEKDKPRIYLKQFSQILAAERDTQIKITPNVAADDFARYPLDPTAYDAEPTCDLLLQELEISGVLIA